MEIDLRLAAITLVAAVVNGAIGYGFSSITVPVALVFLTNRLLNPALVIVEVAANAYALAINRRHVSEVWPQVRGIAVGLPVGISAGTLAVAYVDPPLMKAVTFACLLPVILLQGTGWRRPLASLRVAGPIVGTGVGSLYAMTTISGPPLAVLLTNQGLAQGTFRAGMASLRLVESVLAVAAYAWAGLFTSDTPSLLLSVLPSLAIGLPLGAWIIARVPDDVFRRVCISLDAWLVGFALLMLMRPLAGLTAPATYSLLAGVVLIDAVSFRRFLKRR